MNTPPPANTPSSAAHNVLWLARRLPDIVKDLRPLQSHMMAELESRLAAAQEQGINRDGLRACVDYAFASMGARSQAWGEGSAAARLPAVAIHPDVGVFILHQHTPAGGWLLEDASGNRHVTVLPPGALYTEIQASHATGRSLYRTAGELFRGALRDNRRYFIHAAIASVVINLFGLLTSLYSMQVYDRVIPTQGLSTLYALTAGIVMGIFLELIAKFARATITEHSVRAMDVDLSHSIFERLLRVRMDQFPASVGTLSAQLRSYEMIRSFASSVTLYLLVDTPFAILFLAVIYLLGGPLVAAVPVVFFIVALAVGFLFRRGMERHALSGQAASNRKLGLLVEAVEGAESIKASGAGWQFLARWNGLTRTNIDEDMRLRHLGDSATYYAGFLQQISYVLLVATGAYVASTSTSLTAGGIIACSIISGRVLTPAGMLPGLMVQWANAKSAMRSLSHIFSLEQDNHAVERPLAIDRLRGEVAVQGLEFGYRGHATVLQLENLHIKPGEKVGLLGPVGSGKSTLLKLLSGMYMPSKGRVSLDGIDLQHISRPHLSDRLGYLPQDVRLFAGTLRDNLTTGVLGKTEQHLLAACELTGLRQVIAAHPKGFDMPIAEGGTGVSGGQKQLIALTRMVLAAPDVWLLDEPTASMDETLESRTIAALRASVQVDQTLILVTHKPALLQLVDRLVILSPTGVVIDGPKALVLQQLAARSRPAPAPAGRPGAPLEAVA
ncbi:ATP-binding cassette domain-containing protein [Polaromonas sp. YR568]|uniref:ATP-binding cassette domain-containing protein n=1 Tax=Polaromonas sp. YR568 TaxID=1855301 RepID=UPI00398BE283